MNCQQEVDYMILHCLCLWYGSGKPRMDTYLTPLVTEIKELGNSGFVWKHEDASKLTKVNLGLCASDLGFFKGCIWR